MTKTKKALEAELYEANMTVLAGDILCEVILEERNEARERVKQLETLVEQLTQANSRLSEDNEQLREEIEGWVASY